MGFNSKRASLSDSEQVILLYTLNWEFFTVSCTNDACRHGGDSSLSLSLFKTLLLVSFYLLYFLGKILQTNGSNASYKRLWTSELPEETSTPISGN